MGLTYLWVRPMLQTSTGVRVDVAAAPGAQAGAGIGAVASALDAPVHVGAELVLGVGAERPADLDLGAEQVAGPVEQVAEDGDGRQLAVPVLVADGTPVDAGAGVGGRAAVADAGASGGAELEALPVRTLDVPGVVVDDVSWAGRCWRGDGRGADPE